jgi:Tol biopolymer transport system component
MKKLIVFFGCIILLNGLLNAQQVDYSKLTGKYLGQNEPGTSPELFAPNLVSVGEGVHGNIVFTSNFTEASWHPNYVINGKSLIYIMKYRNGTWQAPVEFFLKEGFNYSEPFYSYDGNKLYYLSGEEGPSGNAQNEKIYYVERIGEGWSEPKLLSRNLPAFHWQFSFDRNSNLYYGGKSDDKKGEIYYSQYKNGEYLNPVRLSEAINLGSPEFSPFISPDNTYIVFVRMIEQQNGPPKTNLFVSFKDKQGNWTQAQNLSDGLKMSEKPRIELIGAPRITPDGKYLFFCSFNGKGHMAYWVSTKVIEELRPKD